MVADPIERSIGRLNIVQDLSQFAALRLVRGCLSSENIFNRRVRSFERRRALRLPPQSGRKQQVRSGHLPRCLVQPCNCAIRGIDSMPSIASELRLFTQRVCHVRLMPILLSGSAIHPNQWDQVTYRA